MCPCPMLKKVHRDNFSFADAMLISSGEGDEYFPLHTCIRPFYDEVFFLPNILLQNRALKMPQFHIKTEAEIENEWSAEVKYKAWYFFRM